jgi:hypothetical protein
MTNRHKITLAAGKRFLWFGLLSLLLPTRLLLAASLFSVDRIELFFENRRAEITVDRNTPALKAFAVIRFTGSGLLQGQWQVDGRPLGFVSQQVFSGQTVALQSPEIPSLPTFDPGTHRVQLVLTNPAPAIPLPTALYFVTVSERYKKRLVLLEPENQSRQRYLAIKFKWKPVKNTAVYLIEFYDHPRDSKPIYSAMTRETTFVLNDPNLTKIFNLKSAYFWKVQGLDQNSSVIRTSEVWGFSFKQ